MLRPVLALASLAFLSLAPAACSNDGAGDTSITGGAEHEQTAGTKLVEAKLYADPDARPSASCDTHTALTVLKTSSGLVLELENRVSGGCEIFVVPDRRSYVVTQDEDGCGSNVFKGVDAVRGTAVSLQDHRARACEDMRPAILELRESRGGREVSLFGTPIASGGDDAHSSVLDAKLYDQPRATVSAGCDKHTELRVTRDGSKLTARLEYKLSATSTCEIYIAPNERVFDVIESDDCGSKVYTGASGADRVTIRDHALRRCENMIPSLIEVELTADGRTANLYSTR